MRARNDNRFIEDAGVSFAMYCDECGLTLAEGIELAEDLADELMSAADSRSSYLPASAGSREE